MALLTIRKDEDPILRKVSRPVEKFDEKLSQLAQDMIDTMLSNEGVGLAGVQVGKLWRIITYDQHNEEGSFVMINPVIKQASGSCKDYEACLSVTETYGLVERPSEITVAYQDLDGNHQELTADENLSRILCHEIDHLDGVLFIDKMIPEPDEDEDPEEPIAEEA
ncbi:MAG: peptide deformylase [Tissierellia bacterium]|nr:peptide deformylase [Tissierellia bacterium]